MPELTTIAFDADDTLWHNETLFHMTQTRFAELLADAADPAHLTERLIAAERRNIGHYGFGVKGFMLSMIETAIEVTEGRVHGSVIAEIMAAGRDMLAHPVDLLPHARTTIEALAPHFRLLIITKGDLLDQERKVAQSGLGDLVHGVEIVSNKTPASYHQIFARHGEGAQRAMMVGNSLKSDVLPALEAGAWGIYVPHDLTWVLEHAEMPQDAARFRSIRDLGDLPSLLESL
jgi:putative hydrolase of the HAD superfamily